MNRSTLWFPYTQMQTAADSPCVESAQGVYLHLADGRRVVDGVASWWCVIHGYRHPEIDEAVREQLSRMAHVMLGGLVHHCAVELAEKLVAITPAGLQHVFFGDSGSVGVEIALKMAIQYWANQGRGEKQKIVALRGAYHGDTCGCMAVCDPQEGMHALFAPLLPRQLFIPAPRCRPEGDPGDVEGDIAPLEELLRERHSQVAALIVEPLLQAAGGFNMYHPRYLQRARELCNRYEVLLIFDEVATGFGRTGRMFAAEKAGVCPDIMVLGKALTAGYIGHSATLTTSRVYDAFLSEASEKAFMHGPTFMGNALACAAALKSIEIFHRDDYLNRIARIESLLREQLLTMRSPQIHDVRVLGATGVIEVHEPSLLRGVQEFALKRGVWLRPFGRYLYTMPPYVISDDELLRVISVMRAWFDEAT